MNQFLADAGAIANSNAANSSFLFKFKQKVTCKIDAANGRKDVEIMVLLKYLSNFWRSLEIRSINSEINLILTWSDKCVLSNHAKATTFPITDTKLYVPVVTLSSQDNAKLLHHLKSGFKRTINWNKCQWKVIIQAPNHI